jgi:hypothetical protein
MLSSENGFLVHGLPCEGNVKAMNTECKSITYVSLIDYGTF